MYIHTHIHIHNRIFSALRKKEILPFAATWMNLEDIMLCEKKPVTERQILHDSTYMKYLNKLTEAENRMVVAGG